MLTSNHGRIAGTVKGSINATESTIDKLIRYEDGRMPSDEVVEFYQELLDSGMIFHLQGHYQRNAQRMVERGQIAYKTEPV